MMQREQGGEKQISNQRGTTEGLSNAKQLLSISWRLYLFFWRIPEHVALKKETGDGGAKIILGPGVEETPPTLAATFATVPQPFRVDNLDLCTSYTEPSSSATLDTSKLSATPTNEPGKPGPQVQHQRPPWLARGRHGRLNGGPLSLPLPPRHVTTLAHWIGLPDRFALERLRLLGYGVPTLEAMLD